MGRQLDLGGPTDLVPAPPDVLSRDRLPVLGREDQPHPANLRGPVPELVGQFATYDSATGYHVDPTTGEVLSRGSSAA